MSNSISDFSSYEQLITSTSLPWVKTGLEGLQKRIEKVGRQISLLENKICDLKDFNQRTANIWKYRCVAVLTGLTGLCIFLIAMGLMGDPVLAYFIAAPAAIIAGIIFTIVAEWMHPHDQKIDLNSQQKQQVTDLEVKKSELSLEFNTLIEWRVKVNHRCTELQYEKPFSPHKMSDPWECVWSIHAARWGGYPVL